MSACLKLSANTMRSRLKWGPLLRRDPLVDLRDGIHYCTGEFRTKAYPRQAPDFFSLDQLFVGICRSAKYLTFDSVKNVANATA